MPDFNFAYLLALQQFREAASPALTQFFLLVSDGFAGPVLILIPPLIYWTMDKRLGARLFCAFISASVVNETLKLIFCVYRPWVLFERLHLAPEAGALTTGYSLPSGHTSTSTATYGTLGFAFRRRVWPLVGAVALSLLIGFSRNFLGAHTLTDVVLATVIGWGAVFACSGIYAYLDAHPERDIALCAGVGLALAVAAVFVATKSYPMDMKNGALLADPALMMADFFKAAGGLAGFMAGRLLERRRIGFSVDVPFKVKVIRVVTSVACVGVVYGLLHLLKGAIPGTVYAFAQMTALSFMAFGAMPALFVWGEKRAKVKSGK